VSGSEVGILFFTNAKKDDDASAQWFKMAIVISAGWQNI
jgi:hypothetical protein